MSEQEKVPSISPLDFQAILSFCIAEQFSRTETRMSSSISKIFSGESSHEGAEWTGEKWVWQTELIFTDEPFKSILKSWGLEVSVEISSSFTQEPQLLMSVMPYFEDPNLEKLEELGISSNPVQVPLLKLAQLQEALKDVEDCALYGYGTIPKQLEEYEFDSEVLDFWAVDLPTMISDFARQVGKSYISKLNNQLDE